MPEQPQKNMIYSALTDLVNIVLISFLCNFVMFSALNKIIALLRLLSAYNIAYLDQLELYVSKSHQEMCSIYVNLI